MLQHKPNGNKKIAQPTSKIYNAASIALHRLQGMNRVVEVKIVIEGTFIKVFTTFPFGRVPLNTIVLSSNSPSMSWMMMRIMNSMPHNNL